MMYLTWHKDLAFLGINDVFHISVSSSNPRVVASEPS